MPRSVHQIAMLVVAVGLAALSVVCLRMLRRWRSERAASSSPEPDLLIDVAALPDQEVGPPGPPPGGQQLEIYHVPVRIAVLVLAPVGRDATLPGREKLPELLDQLTPNLMTVLDRQQPVYRQWPAQLSSQGFVRRFFRHVLLPGEHGKGTPWCVVAGRLAADSRAILVGMVLRAETPNSLSQIEIHRESQWLDVLRVR